METSILDPILNGSNGFLYTLVALLAIFKLVLDCVPKLVDLINSKDTTKALRKVSRFLRNVGNKFAAQLYVPGDRIDPNANWFAVILFSFISALAFVWFILSTAVGMYYLHEMPIMGQVMFAGYLIALVVVSKFFRAEAHRTRLKILK